MISGSIPLLWEHFYSSMYSKGSGGSGSCSSSSILGPWAETGSTSSSSSSLVSFMMMIPPVWSWWQTGGGKKTLADTRYLCLKSILARNQQNELSCICLHLTLHCWQGAYVTAGKKRRSAGTQRCSLAELQWPRRQQAMQHIKRLREEICHNQKNLLFKYSNPAGTCRHCLIATARFTPHPRKKWAVGTPLSPTFLPPPVH